MSDLVKRLRAQRPEDRQVYWRNAELRQVIPIMDEAADALERAERELAAAREVIEQYPLIERELDGYKRERDEALALLNDFRSRTWHRGTLMLQVEDFARIDALLKGIK